MKVRSVLAAIIAVLLSGNANARLLHSGSSAIASNPSLSGVVGFDATMFPFVNFIKMSNLSPQNINVTFIYPNFLLQGSNLPTGTLPAQLGYGVTLPGNYFNEYVFAIGGTVSGGSGYQWGNNNAGWFGQVYAVSAGTTLSGCSNGNVPPCYYQNSLNITGTNPVVTMDFSAPITGAASSGGFVQLSIANVNLAVNNNVTITGVVGSDGNGCGANGPATITARTSTLVTLSTAFNAGCTYTSGGQLWPYQATGNFNPVYFASSGATFSGMTTLELCKLADYNADNTCQTTAGKTKWAGGFNDDFVSSLAAIKPHHLRYLDVNSAVFRNTTDYAGWQSDSAFSYNLVLSFWSMTNWFNSDSGTDNYTINCSNSSTCTYKLTGGQPADGDYFHFYNVNANSGGNIIPTLTVTDANNVTSSTYQMMEEYNLRMKVTLGGTLTTGDTIAMQFNTTPVGAGTCLAGNTHTTAAYTILNTDTIGSAATQLAAILIADTTLSALPSNINGSNPLGGSGSFFFDYASNACAVTMTPVITGSATETLSYSTMSAGQLQAKTLYTAVFSSLHQAFVVNTNTLNAGGQSIAWPWDVQINLAKAVSTKSGLQVGCWLQIPGFWSNASFTSLANYAAANQCPGGTIFEYGNEIWNANGLTANLTSLANSVGLSTDFVAYYELRQRQLWAIASTAFGGLSGNLYTSGMFQLNSISSNELAGLGNGSTSQLCGTGGSGRCSNNYAYQNAIGVNYNSAPNRPADYTRIVGQAPYYQGAVLDGGGYHGSASGYGSWSATSSSVASNILIVSGTVTGTIWWNHGISSCDGTYIAASNPNNPTTAQLSGTVNTTFAQSYGDNTGTWTLTSVAGISAGMWMYDVNTGMVSGKVLTVNSGTNQITTTGKSYRTATSNDTVVFGGLAGTYQLNNTGCAASSGTITGGDVLGLQYATDNYCTASGACSTGNAGLGSVQDAYNWIYQDTLVAANDNQMPIHVTARSMVNSYNIIDAVAATYNLMVWDYEGGYQAAPPSSSQATAIGLPSSGYGYTNSNQTNGFIYTMMVAWKNSASFKQLETTRHNNELALLPTGSMTMWYAFEGANQPRWGLFPFNLYSPPPYQSYDAICDYNGGSC
jgi:hypothetical protein